MINLATLQSSQMEKTWFRPTDVDKKRLHIKQIIISLAGELEAENTEALKPEATQALWERTSGVD